MIILDKIKNLMNILFHENRSLIDIIYPPIKYLAFFLN